MYMAVFDAVDTATVVVYRTLVLVSSHSLKTIGTAVDKVAAADFELLLWHCICAFKIENKQSKRNDIVHKNRKKKKTKLKSWVQCTIVHGVQSLGQWLWPVPLLTLVNIQFAMLVHQPTSQPIDPMLCSDFGKPNRLASNCCIEVNLVCCRNLGWAMRNSNSDPNQRPTVSDSNDPPNWHLMKLVDENRATIGIH